MNDLTPKQKRGFETQQRTLEATLKLLDDRHFEEMTIADIADAAGMAVGNFYKRFKNKEALLPHLYAEYNRRFADMADQMRTQESDDPWHTVVAGCVTFFRDNRGLIRALHLHSRLKPALVPEGNSQSRGSLYRALEGLVTRKTETFEERSLIARTAALMMISTITEAVVYPDMTPAVAAGIGQPELVDQLVAALKAYTG